MITEITINKPTYLKNRVELVFEEHIVSGKKKKLFKLIHNGIILDTFDEETISLPILDTFVKRIESL